MEKKILVVMGVIIFTFCLIAGVYAMCGSCGVSAEKSPAKEASAAGEKAIEVGNKICPVTGDKISKKGKVQYEYKGKIYNFCCPACIGLFKKDPQKYIEKIKKELGSEETGHQHTH